MPNVADAAGLTGDVAVPRMNAGPLVLVTGER